MITRFFLSLFVGIILLLMVAQQSAWVHRQAGIIFHQAFGDALHCTSVGAVTRLNFFWPEIEISNLVVSGKTSDDHGWSWRCKRYRMGFSWVHLIANWVIDMWIAVDHPVGVSKVINGKPAISDHSMHMLETPNFPIPTLLKSLHVNHALCTFIAEQDYASIAWHSNSKSISNQFKTRLQVVEACLYSDGRTFFKQLAGDVTLDVNLDQEDAVAGASAQLQWVMPHIEDSVCYCSASYAQNKGTIKIHNASRALVFDPLELERVDGKWIFRLAGKVPLAWCWYMALATPPPHSLSGDLLLKLDGQLEKGGAAQLEVEIPHLSCYQTLLAKNAKVRMHKNGSALHATIDATIAGLIDASGILTGDIQNQSATLRVTNQTAVALAPMHHWSVLPHDFLAQAELIEGAKMRGSYACALTHTVSNTTKQSAAHIEVQDNQVRINGTLDDHSYDALLDLYPLRAISFDYRSANGSSLLSFKKSSDSNRYDAAIAISLIRSAIESSVAYEMQAEGIIQAEIEAQGSIIAGKIHLKDGTIRLPETYNFMHGFDAFLSYDWAKDYMCITDLDCQLYSGTLSGSRLVAQGLLTDPLHAFIHIPLTLKRCLLNRSVDLFGIISGNFLFQQRSGERPLVQATVLVDRSQLKENIFSDAVQRRLFSSDTAFSGKKAISGPVFNCDIKVHTKDYIRIDTGLLQANAYGALSITNTLDDPHLEGFIKLDKGALKFPYKPLHITRGLIQFIASQQNNPLVELCARNVIKKHAVSLQVTGSLQDHHIQLESNPPLSQEQIIGLLFAGVTQESLTAMMPALIMQNMRQLLFGADQSKIMDRLFKPLFKQLSVTLVPSFSDQTGRGGLRGALEIEVNDRWRALIQKNFSLTEDTRLELEYLLSDDISVRAIRDERRDLGAEVEMRWKF